MTDEHLQLREQATGLVRVAEELAVATKADADVAVRLLANIKAVRKQWTDYWGPVKESAHNAWKGIVGKEKEGTDICDRADATVRSKVSAWQVRERAKAEAEQRRLQAEADERARKERERAEKEAAKLKTPELREQRLQEGAAIQAPAVTVAVPTMAGAGMRSTWKAEAVDMAALIAAAVPGSVAASLLMVNQRAADAFARSTKGAVPVPGIKFLEVAGVSLNKNKEERE